jgi:DNA-directed RNA polymerase specialized sigma24 family protein
MAWNADREMPLFERSEPGEVAAETFDDFYAREFSAVVGLAYALSGSRTGAEDLAKEAFLAAHRGWDRVAAFDDTGAWVRRVVANLAVSAFRRRLSEAKAITPVALGSLAVHSSHRPDGRGGLSDRFAQLGSALHDQPHAGIRFDGK